MNIFIIHRGLDVSYAKLFKRYIEAHCKANVLVLENGGAFWKANARRLIKRANIALLLSGKHTSESSNVGWEILRCLRGNKQIMCLPLNAYESLNLPDDLKDEQYAGYLQTLSQMEEQGVAEAPDAYPVHPDALKRNSFTQEFQMAELVKPIFSLSDAVNRISSYLEGEYHIFNESFDEMNPTQLIEQYKIYLTTSETLVSRRQSVNNFYITVNAAMISIATIASPFINDLQSICIMIGVIACFGMIIDVSWIKLLEAYGVLNSSKMKVISLIERRLPARLYDKEWEAMSDKLNNRKYVSFTDSEKRVPIIFFILYGLALLASIALIIASLCQR